MHRHCNNFSPIFPDFLMSAFSDSSSRLADGFLSSSSACRIIDLIHSLSVLASSSTSDDIVNVAPTALNLLMIVSLVRSL